MDNLSQISVLKKKLLEEINKNTSDISTILSLSNEIANLDNTQIRFSVDAGIINRLGKELVARHETAVSELVKNAYDADATEVRLFFEDAALPGGILQIEDNGVGMTREQLINGFMRLSSSDKIHNPISNKYHRIKAGRKGIGRFSTQRLGKKLIIITQTLLDANATKISINWDDFKTDKDLLSISNKIETIQKIKEEGTILTIEGLREGWSDATIKRVFRYTSELLQPFPLSKKRKTAEKDRTDPGFKSTYFRKNENTAIPIIDEEEAIYKHAVAEIEGYILEDGQGCWSLKSNKLNFPEKIFLIGKNREKEDSKFEFNKDIHFKCYYFIWDSALLPSQSLTFIREVANERGGIRMYRNGFRVSPYGEPGNDWLRLDESVRKRVILTPHGNANFFGFVEITDNDGVKFEETSSREGLIENETLNELIDFIYRTIISGTIKVAELRGRKATASQKKWKHQEDESPTEQVDTAIKDLEQLIDKHDDIKNILPTTKELPNIKDVVEKIKQEREKEKKYFEQDRLNLIEEINMLRILAGLGLVIGEFVHEVKRFLPAFDADTTYIKNVVKDYSEALRRADRLEVNLKSFTAYTAYFDKAISQNVFRELKPIDLRDVVNDFEEVVANDIKRSQIILHKPIFNNFDLLTTPMHPSEWASILFNFYTNSKKSIRRKKIQGEILIKCGKEGEFVFLEFSDNGVGIPVENEELIFNAFFTTSTAASHFASQSESISGTGLGLKIVKDIVESYGGNIYVDTPVSGFSTTLRIEIPSNKNIQNGEI